ICRTPQPTKDTKTQGKGETHRGGLHSRKDMTTCSFKPTSSTRLTSCWYAVKLYSRGPVRSTSPHHTSVITLCRESIHPQRPPFRPAFLSSSHTTNNTNTHTQQHQHTH